MPGGASGDVKADVAWDTKPEALNNEWFALRIGASDVSCCIH